MRMLGRSTVAGVLAALALVVVGYSVPSDAQIPKETPAEVTVKLVKYKELGNIVRQLKGKVVVVDFWSTT